MILAFGLAVAATAADAAIERPNILFIAIDDLNDWVGALGGHPDVKTPTIDALAARGTLFANAHCQSPLCNSSRTSLMTGLRPGTTGIYGLSPWFRDLPEFAGRVTLPQYLSKHGYTTYTTGKIYHGGYGTRETDRGVEWDVIGPGASAAPFPAEKLVKTPSPHKLVDWGFFPHRDEEKGDWKVASWAVEQLQQMPSEPFFLSVGFFLPHVPCYATEKWFDLYPAGSTRLPVVDRHDREDTPRFSWYLHWRLPEPRLKFLEEEDQWMNLVRSYLATISYVDSQVKRVLDALEASGRADDTVVVLWSDHGWHLGEKGITGKNTLWEESTRVPLIFAGPGVAEGAVSSRPVELLDLYPTLVEIAGLPPKDDLEGLSLVPLLVDASLERDRPAITSHNRGNHAVRTDRWRYIRYADGSEELYDHAADPDEWRNLASDEAFHDVKEELSSWLPAVDRDPAPGSAHRILTYDAGSGEAVWEGETIKPDDPVPEI